MNPQNTIKTNKQVKQGCRIQDQCTEITSFLYTRDEQSKKEIKKIILFIRASKRIKCSGINFKKKYKTSL